MALHTLLAALTYITPLMMRRICDLPFKTLPCITIIASRCVQCALRSKIWGMYEAWWHIWGMHSTYRHTGGGGSMTMNAELLWTSGQYHWSALIWWRILQTWRKVLEQCSQKEGAAPLSNMYRSASSSASSSLGPGTLSVDGSFHTKTSENLTLRLQPLCPRPTPL